MSSENIKRYIWQVIPAGTPLLKKKCSKCKNELFYCSDKFRLNSQKRSIDVWLIYRCTHCDTTTNITILSRTKPELIEKELYHRFSMNDEDTAWQYAFDKEIMRKNKMEVDFSQIEYEIARDDISLQHIIDIDADLVEFEIKVRYNLNLKLVKLIRQCFDISAHQLEGLLSAGIIVINPSCSVKKSKIQNGMIITIDRKKLETYFENDM